MRTTDIVLQINDSINPEIEVGDLFVVYRKIDRKMNYNVCLYTGQYAFDKLVYQEYDKHLIEMAKGETPTDIPDGDSKNLYEEMRKYLVHRFAFRREQIAVFEIINNNNDKKLIEYLKDTKTKNMNYCDYIGNLSNEVAWDWETMNASFLSEDNDIAVTSLVNAINKHFMKLNKITDVPDAPY